MIEGNDAAVNWPPRNEAKITVLFLTTQTFSVTAFVALNVLPKRDFILTNISNVVHSVQQIQIILFRLNYDSKIKQEAKSVSNNITVCRNSCNGIDQSVTRI